LQCPSSLVGNFLHLLQRSFYLLVQNHQVVGGYRGQQLVHELWLLDPKQFDCILELSDFVDLVQGGVVVVVVLFFPEVFVVAVEVIIFEIVIFIIV
jgi:hypothetical protein